MNQKKFTFNACKLVLPISLIISLCLLLGAFTGGAQETNPPAPQMQSIFPPSYSVGKDSINFTFDFFDKEGDLDYLQLDIIGPDPYDLPISKIQLFLYADEIDPFQSYNTSEKAVFTDMGIFVTYDNASQKWIVEIQTNEPWDDDNPWSQPIGSDVWPTGIYHFFVKVRDVNGNKWGGDLSYGSYSHYTYCFHSIQTMINSVDSPKTIHVLPGTYFENILINKSNIDMVGHANPVIDGQGSTSIHVVNDSVSLAGFKVENASDSDGSEIGIHIDNVNGGTIRNNNIYKNNFGIQIKDSSNVRICSNEIYANWIPTNHSSYQDCLNGGIGLNVLTVGSGNTNHIIQDNVIHDNHRQGIYLGSPTRNIDDSSSTTNITIKGNQIYDNGVAWSICGGYAGGSGDEYGIYLSATDDCVIGPNNKIYDHNKWTDGAGVFFQNSRDNSLLSNIVMSMTNTSQLANGYIESNSIGIILYNNSINNNIHSNDIKNNDIGIRIFDSTNGSDSGMGNQITKNNILGNSQYGVAYGLGGGATTVIQAQHNWWGTSTGPFHPSSNPSGAGNEVSDHVNYSDWLTFSWYNIVWVDSYYDENTPGWNITHFDTITSGLQSSYPYGVLNVKPGTYREVLQIDKPVTLHGSFGSDVTTITDEGSTYSQMQQTNGHTVQIAHSNVVIEDVTIMRTGYTSYHPIATIGNLGRLGLSDIYLNNCTIESVGLCTAFTDVENLTVSDLIFLAQLDDRLISISNSTHVTLYNNTLNDYNLIGITLDNCQDSTIQKNIIHQKSYRGIELIDCENITLSELDHDYNYEDAISLFHANDIIIKDSTFSNSKWAIHAEKNVTVLLDNNAYSSVNHSIYGLAYLSDEERYYGDVQEAINQSTIGGTITVFSGVFQENIVIDKKVEIKGNGTVDQIIIEGDPSAPTVLIGGNRTVKQITIDGISLKGGLHCLQTQRYKDISGLSILNCRLTNAADTSLYIDPHNYSDTPPIRDGTDLFTSPVQIQNTYVRGGVYFRFHPFELYGVDVNTQLKMNNNDIDNMFLDGSIAVIIENNFFYSLGMAYSSDIQINHNIFENPWEERYGIYLWSIDGLAPVKNVNISHNTITGYNSITVGSGVSGQGILLAGALNVDILNNQILANTDGIFITEEYVNRNGEVCAGDVIDVLIRNNDIENGQNGIRLSENVTGLSMINNKININGRGIWLHQASEHVIKNNSLIGNYYGIRIDEGSEENIIYNNYFNDNFVNARDPYSTTNKWNISLTPGTNIMGGPYLGGNYWDDYTGEDTDGDGIGDESIPYNASGEIVHNGDFLPLVFTDDVSPEVTVIYPNGGEVLSGDIQIRWNATDDIDPNLSIDIEYSNDNGSTWDIISPNENNDGAYVWNTSAVDEGNYLIKVTATDSFGNTANDTSDAPFSIYREYPGPQITLDHPQMGYVYFFGVQKVRFLSQNCFAIGHLDIEATVETSSEIEKVEFYIDDLLMHIQEGNTEQVYTWKWDEAVLFTHEIKVIAYDVHGGTSEDSIEVTIFNFNIIP